MLLQQVEVPVPSASKGEVLVKVEATTLNPIDWKLQKGALRPFMPKKFPYIPGKTFGKVYYNMLYIFKSFFTGRSLDSLHCLIFQTL